MSSPIRPDAPEYMDVSPDLSRAPNPGRNSPSVEQRIAEYWGSRPPAPSPSSSSASPENQDDDSPGAGAGAGGSAAASAAANDDDEDDDAAPKKIKKRPGVPLTEQQIAERKRSKSELTIRLKHRKIAIIELLKAGAKYTQIAEIAKNACIARRNEELRQKKDDPDCDAAWLSFFRNRSELLRGYESTEAVIDARAAAERIKRGIAPSPPFATWEAEILSDPNFDPGVLEAVLKRKLDIFKATFPELYVLYDAGVELTEEKLDAWSLATMGYLTKAVEAIIAFHRSRAV